MRACSQVKEIGQTIDAGIPNIVGALEGGPDNSIGYATGAFRTDGNTSGTTEGSRFYFNNVSFDASRCSQIYGNSNTIMPASVNIPIIIYLGK